MSERVYKLVLEPEYTGPETVYVIDRSGEPEVTEDTAGDAFDTILCDYDGMYLDGFELVSKEDIPAYERPYEIG